MSFNYEQSVWGVGKASLSWIDPTSFRLRQGLKALTGLKSGNRILEVGCGAGQFIRAIKKLKPELDCYGCDISQAALVQAKQTDGQVAYNLSELNRLPYDDNYFQAVLIFDVLEHIEDVSGMLGEINRVLVPGGIFHCFVPCEGDWLSVWHWLEKLKLVSGLTKSYAGHIQKFSRRSLRQVIRQTGFDILGNSYSSHCLAQWVDVAIFVAMDRAARRPGVGQMNNEKFLAELNQSSGRAFFMIKKIINWMANAENFLFSYWPSANVHLTMKK